MNNRNAIQEELRDMNSSLPFDVKKPVFSVPEGYFENFASSVLARTKGEQAVTAADELQQLSPTLAAISKKTPYAVPEGYFSHAAENLPALIGDDDLPQFLAQHDKKLPYEIPAGYFDALPASLLKRVTAPKTKVITLNTRKWMRVAAAAMVGGLIAVSGFFYFQGKRTIDPAEQPQTWIAAKLKGVSKQALDEFIQTADIDANRSKTQNSDVSLEVRSLLQDVSVTEIDAFLNSVPTDDELSVIN